MENITIPNSEIPVIIEKPKTNYLSLILISFAFILFLAGAYYLGKQSVKTPETSVGVLPQTTAIPTPTINPVDWKTYRQNNFEFKYPSDFVKNSEQRYDDRYQDDFVNIGNGYILSIIEYPNYDAKTGKPYLDIDDFIGLNYPLDKILIDTQDSRLVCPRAGCENTLSVMMSSNNQKSFYSLSLMLDNPEKLIPQSEFTSAKIIFDQILSTFKFTESKAEVSSLPNSKELQINKDYSSYFIFNKQKIIFDMKPVDYPGQIIFSPNKKFACIDYGISGDWGYHIFDLQLNKTILSSSKYSAYCQSWTQSNQLIVKEIPYGQSISTFYMIDPITLNKTIYKQ